MDINRIDEVERLTWQIKAFREAINRVKTGSWEDHKQWLKNPQRDFPIIKESLIETLKKQLSELEEKFTQL